MKDAMLPELQRLVASGDFETALSIAEGVFSGRLDEELQSLIDCCRERVADDYGARLGDLNRMPRLKVPSSDWVKLELDHRACFLLVHVDGASSYETIVDTSGMSRHEALRVLVKLLEQGIILA
jgi:hypothetical protein